eukprot:TRINITY_DN3082_c0_g1_i6.p1 TRINITY_DN3082_c0_g1~~TRINITY_DN3082_c0_g1_i6.p1  ORF type:complete len:143 (+),score=11.59 TRINITY_DN3082_c0_g1_i6:48-431(+)
MAIIFFKRKKGNRSHRKAANSGNSVSKIPKWCISSNTNINKLPSIDSMEVFCARYGHLNIELPISQEESISILLQEEIRENLTPRVIKATAATDASSLKKGIRIKTNNTTRMQSKEADCSNSNALLK